MSNPILGINTSVLFKEEAIPGTREALTTGAVHADLISEGLDYVPVLTDFPVLAGNRQALAEMRYVSHHDGGGPVVFRPRHAQMAQALALMLGPIQTSVYVPIEDNTDLPSATFEISKAGMNTLALVGCKVNTSVLRSEQNGPLEIELNLIARSGVRGSTNTAFAATQMIASNPYMHAGLSFSAGPAWFSADGVAFNPEARKIEVTLNNNLDDSAFTNSSTRRIIPVGIFQGELSVEIPYNSYTKAFWTDMAAATKVAITAVWTDNAAKTLTMIFTGKLVGELPKISGSDNVWITAKFINVYDVASPHSISFAVSA